ncbi:MAG: CHRD domain-containing protein [Micropepsaceae bacterium]
MFRFAVTVLAAFAFAWPAMSAGVVFTASLRGDKDPTNTGSKATGEAKIVVDTTTQTVDVDLKVVGIKVTDFWAQVHHAPVGPIHLHHYAANGDVTLVMPFPAGPSYQPADGGFTVTVRDYPFAKGATIVKTPLTFEQFMGALKAGIVVLNIHTAKFNDGEISGTVTEVK